FDETDGPAEIRGELSDVEVFGFDEIRQWFIGTHGIVWVRGSGLVDAVEGAAVIEVLLLGLVPAAEVGIDGDERQLRKRVDEALSDFRIPRAVEMFPREFLGLIRVEEL